ncbi:IS1 family transposase [Endozoicomonas sp.]|nr:IS1 family transposase [Endozoicomonas sp.]
MTCLIAVKCPKCNQTDISKHGFGRKGNQRYLCNDKHCPIKSFMLEYHYHACDFQVKEKILKMAINSAGIRDTFRVLDVSKTTVIKSLKSKESLLQHVNPNIKTIGIDESSSVHVQPACDIAELDEQWSYVKDKSNQRWLWLAIDHDRGVVLAYVFGRRKDEVFQRLKALLEPFGISRFYSDDWGAYERNMEPEKHEVGKRNTQKIERKNLNFRTWIKRLARRTICFSKLEKMHDIVIGLLINKVEFGIDIYAQQHI